MMRRWGYAPGLALLGCAALAQADVCRVTPTGAGVGTWNDTSTLQAALGNAQCTEIWLAAGVYRPSASDRAVSFVIKPGVAVYGGFAGTETVRAQRAPALHRAVLSGDIDADDIDVDGNAIAESTADIQGSNSYQVVVMDGTTGTPLLADTTLDGVTITAGNADGNPPLNSGGGVYCNGVGAGSVCSPTVRNVVFSGNAGKFGAGMSNHAKVGIASPTVRDVTFTGNAASFEGGAMINYATAGGTSSPSLVNVSFSANQALFKGGAMRNDAATSDSVCSPLMTNLTFAGNSATNGGAIVNQGVATVQMHNVILWGNSATQAGNQIHNTGSAAATIDHSLVQGSGGSGNWDAALGIDGGGNLDADPLLGPLGDHGGLTPTRLPGMPGAAIDAGTCAGAPSHDQRGVARPQGAACDIGAVELVLDRIFADGVDAAPIP